MKLHIVLFSLLVVTLAGCTAATTTENLAGARLLIENNDFASAQSMCDEVRNAVESDDSDVEVEDLCKLAILYMQLASHIRGKLHFPQRRDSRHQTGRKRRIPYGQRFHFRL